MVTLLELDDDLLGLIAAYAMDERPVRRRRRVAPGGELVGTRRHPLRYTCRQLRACSPAASGVFEELPAGMCALS